MGFLLRPAELLLNRLRYSYKIALIGLVFFVPLAFLGQQLLVDINADIERRERELLGLRHLSPLSKLIQAVQRHRGLQQLWYRGDPEAPQLMADADALIANHLQAFDALDARTGTTLGSTADWAQLKRQWNALHDDEADIPAVQSFQRHSEFIAALLDYMQQLADQSNLSLDAELDIHHLVIAASRQLPQLTESLGQLRGLSALAHRHGIIPQRDRYRMAEALGDSMRSGVQLQASLDKAAELMPGLNDRISGKLGLAIRATDAFLGQTEQLMLLPDGSILDSRTIFRQGSRAIDSIFHLQDFILVALQQEIEAEVANQRQSRLALIASGAAAVLVAAYLFLGFVSMLIRQMSVMQQSANAVVQGRLDTRIALESRDEMARIAGHFNDVVAALRDQMAKLAANEARLRESEKHIRVLFNSGNDPILVYECDAATGAPTGCFVEVNDIACTRLGFTRQELLRMQPEDILAEEAAPPPYFKLAYRRAAVFESVHLTRSGKVIPVEVNAHLFELYDKVLVFAMARDITERKQAEEKQKTENALAHDVIERLMLRHGAKSDPGLKYWLKPAENFSGDVIASARSSDGTLYALLADASGHGLTAAITVVPLLTLFYRLVELEHPLGYIALELNRELMSTMPAGRFVAISLVSIDPVTRTALIWQGGMPEILHLDAEGRVKERYSSPHLPLGIVEFDEDMAALRTVLLQPGDHLAMFSDGLIEACNSGGEAFSLRRIEEALACRGTRDQIGAVQAALQQHQESDNAHDDISLLLIDSDNIPAAATL